MYTYMRKNASQSTSFKRNLWKILGISVIAGFGLLLSIKNPAVQSLSRKAAGFAYKTITGNVQRAQTPSAGPLPVLRVTEATGPLRVNPANRRYFTDDSGRAILLSGSHTWYTMQDAGFTDPPPALNYTAWLDFLQSHGHNFFRTFVWEQAKWTVAISDPFWFSPLPYQRPGPGTALDGKPKFNLTAYNQAYFDRLRLRVIQAGQRGIYVSLQLFDGFSVAAKPAGAANNPWVGHPYNLRNNINGINGDLNGDGQGEDSHSLAIPAVTALQEAYIRKLVDTVNDLDNVLYEVCNEANGGSQNWQNHIIDYIHDYEASKPKQHPVGYTVEWPGGDNAVLFASSADWISPNGNGGYDSNPPAADGSKVILSDTDHIWGIGGDRTWAWKTFTRGMNPIFMDVYNCSPDLPSSGCNSNDPTWVSLRRNLGYILNYANRMNLAGMVPHGELASSGYALAHPGSRNAEYLVYLPSGGASTVDLRGSTGPMAVEWLNPSQGSYVQGNAVQGGALRSFTPPFSGDAVLYIYQNQTDSRLRYYLPIIQRRR